MSFRGGWLGSNPHLFISQCLNLQAVLGTREKGRDPCALPKATHNIKLFLGCTRPPWISPASIHSSLTQTLLIVSPQPPFPSGRNQYPRITFLPLPATAANPNLLLEGFWHLHSWHILWGACACASQTDRAVQPHCLSHTHIFPPPSKTLDYVHCAFRAGPNSTGFNIQLVKVFVAFVENFWVRICERGCLILCGPARWIFDLHRDFN